MNARWLACLCTVVILACSSSTSRAAAKKDSRLPRTEGWIECRTEHFTLYSSASTGKTRKAAIQLERFRQALGRMTSGFELDAHVPTSTFIFRNDAGYRPYKLRDDGEVMNVSGYFLPRPFHNYITLDATAGSQPMRIVYHEFFHAVMDASLGSLPTWLNEGLAEYFSTFRDRAGSAVVEVGHPIEEHLAYLARNEGIPWREVFETTPSSATYNEAVRQGAFYAQSWLLVHYLNATNDRSAQLGRYLSLLRSGVKDDEAFVTAFGSDRASLAARVDAYRNTGSNYVWWDFGEEHGDVETTVRHMRPAEVLFRLGELLAQRGQQDAARRHLDAAARAGWPAAAVQGALGVAALYAGDAEAAEPLLRQSIASELEEAEPYVLLAGLLLDRFLDTPEATRYERQTAPAVLETRELLERGLAHDATNFHALVALARTYLFESGDTGPGAAALDRARGLRPLDPTLLTIHASLLARAGKVEQAWSVIVDELIPLDREEAREAAEFVASGVAMTAMHLAGSDDSAAAVALLDRAIEAIGDSPESSELARMRQVLASGGRIVLTEDTGPGSEQPGRVQDYNRAVRFVSSGQHEEALAIFERLANDCTEGPICEQARTNAAELSALLEHNRIVARFNEAVGLVNRGERKAAVAQLRELEQQVDDPELLQEVQRLLRSLGARVSKQPS